MGQTLSGAPTWDFIRSTTTGFVQLSSRHAHVCTDCADCTDLRFCRTCHRSSPRFLRWLHRCVKYRASPGRVGSLRVVLRGRLCSVHHTAVYATTSTVTMRSDCRILHPSRRRCKRRRIQIQMMASTRPTCLDPIALTLARITSSITARRRSWCNDPRSSPLH